MEKAQFEIIDHTADWSIRVWGRDLADLLFSAAYGMNSLLVNDLATIPVNSERTLELDTYDPESLLVEWLGELAYWTETEGLVFCQFELQEVGPTHLRAKVGGARPEQLQKHVKAVTYHQLQIIETQRGLEATIVFDV